MDIIIQKFGGTSVVTHESREMAVQRVADAIANGAHPVVVVSAMGRKGQPYATDSLRQLVSDYVPTSRDMDMLMACGEAISTVVFASQLRSHGIDACAVSGGQAGIITDEQFGSSSPTEDRPERLLELINDGFVPVVAGFQGVTERGDVTTLGRGGSDTSAAILGRSLHARLVEIYTDVSGIMTADPRIVPQARVLPEASYTEVFQMAAGGATVIHPRAVEIAMNSGIPMVVRGTAGNGPGTLITDAPDSSALEHMPGEVVSNISHISGRTQLSVRTGGGTCMQDILSGLTRRSVSIDLINIFPDSLVFTVDSASEQASLDLFSRLGCEYSVRRGCAKISAIGGRMRGVPGVMARIYGALLSAGVEVLQTSDSHMSISCLVSSEQAGQAILALHNEFGLERQGQ